MAAAPGSLFSGRETARAKAQGAEGLVELRNCKNFDAIGASGRVVGDEAEETGKVGHKGSKDLGFYPDGRGGRGGL